MLLIQVSYCKPTLIMKDKGRTFVLVSGQWLGNPCKSVYSAQFGFKHNRLLSVLVHAGAPPREHVCLSQKLPLPVTFFSPLFLSLICRFHVVLLCLCSSVYQPSISPDFKTALLQVPNEVGNRKRDTEASGSLLVIAATTTILYTYKSTAIYGFWIFLSQSDKNSMGI